MGGEGSEVGGATAGGESSEGRVWWLAIWILIFHNSHALIRMCITGVYWYLLCNNIPHAN